ncbi:MAG: DEAD/DEAH box helicase [Candidatus Xenobia bacterium]
MSTFDRAAREACIRRLGRLPAECLDDLLPRELRGMLHLQKGQRLDAAQLATALVDLHGPELLRDAAVRRCLVEEAHDEDLATLYRYGDPPPAQGRSAVVEGVVGRNWHPGKGWARHFVRTLQLPEVLCGVPGPGQPPPFEVIPGYTPLPLLHPYQENLRDKLIKVLNAPTGENRAILSLPTGAGKTRTAVEAIVQEMITGDWTGATFLWIAQSEELCEQALESFRMVWVDYSVRIARYGCSPHLPPLRLTRVWAERRVPEPPENGVAVASIQKLRSLCDRLSPEVAAFFAGIDAVVIDEAHHATAPEYTAVLGLLKQRTLDANKRPLIGLTATPYRTNTDEARRLARRFGERLLIPEEWTDPMEELRRLDILSSIQQVEVRTHHLLMLSAQEENLAHDFKTLPASAVGRVGRDRARNELILKTLLDVPPGKPTLMFACSVQHAQLMGLLLRERGRSAAALTADTPRALRRAWIEAFREGEIQFLCNYGILTTGFDAPKVEVVAVARPTTSELVYEQMIGRGMRGERNGGTKTCTVIDFVDAMALFGGPMSYARYEAIWRQP